MKRIVYTLIGLLAFVAAPLVRAPLVRAQVVGANQTITVVDSGTACVTAPTACATYALDNQTAGLTISVSGTWTGTLTFEGTNNDGIWTALPAQNVATSVVATTATANGLYTVTNVGVIKVRVRATAAITGSALITAAKGLGFTGSRAVTSGGVITAPQLLAPDGTALLPAYSFASEPTLGFWRVSAALVRLQGSLSVTGEVVSNTLVTTPAAGFFQFVGRALLASPANGSIVVENNAATIGSQLKADALPTVASGFGTSPAVTAGSTPFAGSVNVGTGAPGTTGTVNFAGTAFPSAPFCQANNTITLQVVKAAATTTQLVLTSAGFTVSDVVTWLCVSSK
jgi:hypothetical protein